MKHNARTTVLLLGLFFLSQIIGLLIVQAYIDPLASTESGEAVFSDLPFDLERPPIEQDISYLYIIAAILVGTALVLLLIKFNKTKLWKVWYALAVVMCLTIALSAFMPSVFAFVISVVAACFKVRKSNPIIHNVTELFIYGGLAAIFVPVISVSAGILLLIAISIYDYIAVNKVKHMITMAKFQTKTNVFAGLVLGTPAKNPSGAKRRKQRSAILGGGDIGFTLLFSGAVFKGLVLTTPASALITTLIVPACATVALGILLFNGQKGKFYPAMPSITVGCLLGYLITLTL